MQVHLLSALIKQVKKCLWPVPWGVFELPPECARPGRSKRSQAMGSRNLRACCAVRSLLRSGTGALRWYRQSYIARSSPSLGDYRWT